MQCLAVLALMRFSAAYHTWLVAGPPFFSFSLLMRPLNLQLISAQNMTVKFQSALQCFWRSVWQTGEVKLSLQHPEPNTQ